MDGLTLSLRVGVDIVDVEALAQMLEGDPMFERISWTERELHECRGSAERLAARWAAKEAVMKVLGRGIGDIEPTDIEIVGGGDVPPRLVLHDSAKNCASRMGAFDWSLSVSHEAGLAIAFVVAQVSDKMAHEDVASVTAGRDPR